jgi:hypothetical protein
MPLQALPSTFSLTSEEVILTFAPVDFSRPELHKAKKTEM